jgi:prevent-host-death family protein
MGERIMYRTSASKSRPSPGWAKTRLWTEKPLLLLLTSLERRDNPTNEASTPGRTNVGFPPETAAREDVLVAVSTGARLGPYEILEPLGAGGMGEVYRARGTRLEREVGRERFWVSTSGRRRRRARRTSWLDVMTTHDHNQVMNRVGIADLKAHLSHHLRRVRGGRTLTVVDRDTPVARIVPYDAETPLEVRRATRKPADLRVPPPPPGPTDSLSVLLRDRASR